MPFTSEHTPCAGSLCGAAEKAKGRQRVELQNKDNNKTKY